MSAGVAFITGGVSGLGEATSHKLLSEGFDVMMVDLNEEKGAAAVEKFRAQFPGRQVNFAKVDVVDEAQVRAAVNAATEMGPLRVVVNSAGMSIPGKIAAKGKPMALKTFQLVVNINLVGTFNVSRLCAAAMQAKTPAVGEDGYRGVIINVASVAAFDGQIGQVPYSAAKAGITGMTLPMARDLSSSGIRVLTIAPGVINTPMMAMAPQSMKDGLSSEVPFPKRLGAPEEFASLVAEMVRNGYLNGEVVRLDGSIRMTPKSKM